MIVNTDYIRKELTNVWKDLKFIWLVDKQYIIPTLDELNKALKDSKVEQMKFMNSINDCDDFALQLHASVKRMRGKLAEDGKLDPSEQYPWAFGEVIGMQFRGRSFLHSQNICICQDGVYLVEPQEDRTWIADSKNDTVFFVRM